MNKSYIDAVNENSLKPFVERLHLFLDECGVQKKSGRLTRLAVLSGVSLTAARKWLEGISVPRAANLDILIKNTKELLPEDLKEQELMQWLLTGGESPLNKTVNATEEVKSNTNSVDTGEVYVKVLDFASKKNINLYDERKFPREEFDKICKSFLRYKKSKHYVKEEEEDILDWLVRLAEKSALY